MYKSGVWFVGLFLMELELEYVRNWNPIPYSVWFADMSDEFDFGNAKWQNYPFSFFAFFAFFKAAIFD